MWYISVCYSRLESLIRQRTILAMHWKQNDKINQTENIKLGKKDRKTFCLIAKKWEENVRSQKQQKLKVILPAGKDKALLCEFSKANIFRETKQCEKNYIASGANFEVIEEFWFFSDNLHNPPFRRR